MRFGIPVREEKKESVLFQDCCLQGYVNHSQNIFIQVHDSRVAEQKVEVLQRLR